MLYMILNLECSCIYTFRLSTCINHVDNFNAWKLMQCIYSLKTHHLKLLKAIPELKVKAIVHEAYGKNNEIFV